MLRGIVAFGLAALAAGCGGSDDDEKATTQAAAPPPVVETATAPPVATTPATSSGRTSPGTELKVGAVAHVDIKPLDASINSTQTYPLDVMVLKIEKGSLDDFKNIKLDADQKKATPYYVTVRITAAAAKVPVKNDDPDIRFNGIDDRGQEQGSVTFFGDFARCDDKSAPDPFTRDKEYTSCLTYLVGGGGSIAEVRWAGSDKYVLKPVVWK